VSCRRKVRAVVSVITVENIGKRYRVGEIEVGGLLRDHIASALSNPASLLRRKPRDEFWALRDISFEVQEGEVLGLIGRNGAGKSTLLKILSRITAPTVGRAEIRGRVGSLLEVGTGFHPELTGRENVFLNGAILGMGKREIARKFDEIVAFAEVERFIDTPVKRYSSGMYVRLAFAVAAHLETEVLFVDEVLSVGDVQFQKKCLGKMGDVANQGRTVIFVSHNLNAVSALCNSIILLELGQLKLHSGNVAEALRRYTNPALVSHTVDLSMHPNRTSRTAAFEAAAVGDEDHGPTHRFRPGARVVVQLRLNPSTVVRSPKISIGMTNFRSERVFAIGTHIGGNAISSIDGPSTVIVRFTLPFLVPGEYALDMGLYEHSGSPIDEIYGAMCLEVLKDDYLSMVDPHEPYMGNLMVRSTWECCDVTSTEGGGPASRPLAFAPSAGSES
jgi:lipopolysaccharide transport system ATP-binding protein